MVEEAVESLVGRALERILVQPRQKQGLDLFFFFVETKKTDGRGVRLHRVGGGRPEKRAQRCGGGRSGKGAGRGGVRYGWWRTLMQLPAGDAVDRTSHQYRRVVQLMRYANFNKRNFLYEMYNVRGVGGKALRVSARKITGDVQRGNWLHPWKVAIIW